jgi:hypothetical protein
LDRAKFMQDSIFFSLPILTQFLTTLYNTRYCGILLQNPL